MTGQNQQQSDSAGGTAGSTDGAAVAHAQAGQPIDFSSARVRNRLKPIILIPLFVTFAVALLVFVLASWRIQQSSFDDDMKRRVAAIINLYERQLQNDADLMAAALETIILNADIKEAFQNRDRDRLLAITAPLFQNLETRAKITHFYFSNADRINFVRVHNPDEFGDIINRPTTLRAEANLLLEEGLGLGPMGSLTQRVVIPWIDGSDLIGYVELGKETNHNIGLLENIVGAKAYSLVNKSYLNRERWTQDRRARGLDANWDRFDKLVLVSDHLNKAIDPNIEAAITNHAKRSDPSLSWGRLPHGNDNDHIRYYFLPIDDTSGSTVGQLLVFIDVTIAQHKFVDSMSLVISICIFLFISLGMVFSTILNGVRDNLERADTNLIGLLREAQVSSRAKSEFLATMSHELRTPLNAILGFSKTMTMGIFGKLNNDRYEEYLNDIHQSGVHLLSLINDVLDISKIEAGKFELYEETVNIRELFDSVTQTMREEAKKSGLTLTTTLEDDLPDLFGDHRRLQQLLLNLLSNSVKFTPEGGKVTASARTASDGCVIFAISDTGIGMAPEDIPVALDTFSQIDSSLSRKYEGSGLGLPLCKRFAELHDATLSIESEINSGTTVNVHFPLNRSLPGTDNP